MIYEDVLRAFNRAKVRFVVVGGIAFNLLGGYRSTGDLDIMLAMDDENLRKAVKILLKKGYRVKLPVDPLDFADKRIRSLWIKNKNLKAFNRQAEIPGFQTGDECAAIIPRSSRKLLKRIFVYAGEPGYIQETPGFSPERFIFYKYSGSYEEVDIIVGSPVSFGRASRDAKKIKIGRFSIPVVSVGDLIRMKRAAGRPQDLLDIKELKMIGKLKV